MDAYLLIDFGSTYTKVCSVDIDSETVLGWAQAPTTVDSDINIGFKKTIDLLDTITGKMKYSKKLACSSAAGGLTVMASGLVESLTMKAAQMAALGAGAKVTQCFHHYLTKSDLHVIESKPPDIFLLSGGTDGGNSEVILYNAKQLAALRAPFVVVYAGNRVPAYDVEQIIKASGKEVFVCPNIMPSIDKLNIEPTNEIIRDLFISRITKAKGIKEAEKTIDGVLMPTPYAVLTAAALLSDGTEDSEGFGELMVIDAGGATTDVHSICEGYSNSEEIVHAGFMEPRVKRTVEGDLGVRYNAESIIENANLNGFKAILEKISGQPSIIFKGSELEFDSRLCEAAVNIAVKRHCGTLEKHFTSRGVRYLQQGKDFTGLRAIIGSGGPIINAANPAGILKAALNDKSEPDSLRPQNPLLYLDKKYIMYAMGLLSTIDKNKALRILKKEIINISRERYDGNV